MAKTIGEVRQSLKNCQYWAEWHHKRHLEAYVKYAIEMFEFLIEPLNLWSFEEDETEMPEISEEILLNGAPNWIQYSKDGNSLYNSRDICHRLCDFEDWDFFQDGKRNPKQNQDWLEAQGDALRKACQLLLRVSK